MNHDQWLEARRTCIGASDAAAILGESPWQSPYSIWANKVHGIDLFEESERMKWGTVLEPVIAEEFTIWAESNIPNYGGISGDGKTLYRSKAYEFIGASPDRFVCDVNGNNIGLLEIKTTDGRNSADWKDAPPLQYQIQVQHQLYVTGLVDAWIAVLIGGNRFQVYPVARNDRFIEVLIREERHFWQSDVETETPPPTDGHSATTAALKLLHPNDTGGEIELEADEWLPKLDRLERIKAARKRLDEQESVIQNELKSVIQDSTFAHVGEKTVSFKTQTRPAHEVKESTFRVLRIGKRKQQK